MLHLSEYSIRAAGEVVNGELRYDCPIPVHVYLPIFKDHHSVLEAEADVCAFFVNLCAVQCAFQLAIETVLIL